MEHERRLRKPDATEGSDEEWAVGAPSLTVLGPEAPQRVYDLREVVHAVPWSVRAGAPWRRLPTTFPPGEAVSQQTRRWFAAMGPDRRALLR